MLFNIIIKSYLTIVCELNSVKCIVEIPQSYLSHKPSVNNFLIDYYLNVVQLIK